MSYRFTASGSFHTTKNDKKGTWAHKTFDSSSNNWNKSLGNMMGPIMPMVVFPCFANCQKVARFLSELHIICSVWLYSSGCRFVYAGCCWLFCWRMFTRISMLFSYFVVFFFFVLMIIFKSFSAACCWLVSVCLCCLFLAQLLQNSNHFFLCLHSIFVVCVKFLICG